MAAGDGGAGRKRRPQEPQVRAVPGTGRARGRGQPAGRGAGSPRGGSPRPPRGPLPGWPLGPTPGLCPVLPLLPAQVWQRSSMARSGTKTVPTAPG